MMNIVRGPKRRMMRAERNSCAKMLTKPMEAIMRPMYSGLGKHVNEAVRLMRMKVPEAQATHFNGCGVD